MIFTEKQLEYFDRYVRVQKSGKFNMLTDSRRAQAAARLSRDAYWFVVENYSALSDARRLGSNSDEKQKGSKD
jgi:hypothetical protein